MDKDFKDLSLEERIEHAQQQSHFWRDVLRQLNRELTAVTPEERDTLRARVVEAVETAAAASVEAEKSAGQIPAEPRQA